jgi:hypothetical protein
MSRRIHAPTRGARARAVTLSFLTLTLTLAAGCGDEVIPVPGPKTTSHTI